MEQRTGRRRLLLLSSLLLCFFVYTMAGSGRSAYAAGEKATADLLIVNGLIVSMAADEAAPQIGAIAIGGGRILAIGPSGELSQKYAAKKIIDASNKIVMPGLINTHTHAAMTLLRGYADDQPLKQWLEQHIWPAEAAYMDARAVRLGTELAIVEMLHAGETTFNDMYFFEDEVATAAYLAGMRAVVAESLLDFPTPSAATPAAALAYTEYLRDKWQDNRLITIAVAPHSPYACSADLLLKARQLARTYRLPLHIHVAETQAEVEDLRKRTGYTPVAYLNSLGLLGNNTIAAHCVHLTPGDIELLARTDTGVAHNPISNAKLASGVAPVPELLAAGVKVGLGTDGAASNNRLDLFAEMAMAATVHKAVRADPTVVNAYAALKMATLDAARVLDLADKIGSLERGKQADLIIIDRQRANATPMYNVYSHLVYANNSASVETVIIDGRVVMEKGRILTVNEEEILRKASRFADRLRLAGENPKR